MKSPGSISSSELQRDETRHIAQRVLQRQADDGRHHGGGGENARDVDAELVEEIEDDGDVSERSTAASVINRGSPMRATARSKSHAEDNLDGKPER